MKRTNAKEMLIAALQNDMPPGVANFVSVEIPTLTAISVPATKDNAIIAQGVLAANINKILKTFEGFTPIELLLRIGQNSNTAIALALAHIKATRKVGAYYDTDLQAAAETLKEQIEGVTPVDGEVSIDEEFWQGLYTGVGELLAAFKASPDAADAWYDAIQVTQVIAETIDGMAEDLEHIADSTWMSLTSLARLLLDNVNTQGGLM